MFAVAVPGFAAISEQKGGFTLCDTRINLLYHFFTVGCVCVNEPTLHSSLSSLSVFRCSALWLTHGRCDIFRFSLVKCVIYLRWNKHVVSVHNLQVDPWLLSKTWRSFNLSRNTFSSRELATGLSVWRQYIITCSTRSQWGALEASTLQTPSCHTSVDPVPWPTVWPSAKIRLVSAPHQGTHQHRLHSEKKNVSLKQWK